MTHVEFELYHSFQINVEITHCHDNGDDDVVDDDDDDDDGDHESSCRQNVEIRQKCNVRR